MSYPTYYISSSIVSVDTSTESKIIMLPPAIETIEIKPMIILDRTGNASVNNIYLSTQIDTLMDNRLSTIIMSTDFQSLQIIPYSTTRYAITTNYTAGLSPFIYALQILLAALQFGTGLSFYTYNSCAISDNGNVVLAVGTGTDPVINGVYVSEDQGSNYSNVLGIEASNANAATCCMSSTGQFMFVTTQSGKFSEAGNFGSTWSTDTYEYTFSNVTCSSDGSNVATLGSGAILFKSGKAGALQVIRAAGYDEIINCIAMSGNGQKIYVGFNATFQLPNIQIGTLGTDFKGDPEWTFLNRATDGPNNGSWTQIVCNSDGSIAYATVYGGEGLPVTSLYKTTDTGVTWTLLNNPILAEVGLISCDSTGNILFIQSNTDAGNIYFSTDGATTFTLVTGGGFGVTANPASLSVSRLGGYLAFGQQYIPETQGRINTGQIRLA
jgi:hypothetical protein